MISAALAAAVKLVKSGKYRRIWRHCRRWDEFVTGVDGPSLIAGGGSSGPLTFESTGAFRPRLLPEIDALAILRALMTINPMPFEIRTVRSFSAAHQLRLYDGSIEPVHGHNWRVEVTVSATQLDAIGVVMDFHELERLLDDIIRPMHN